MQWSGNDKRNLGDRLWFLGRDSLMGSGDKPEAWCLLSPSASGDSGDSRLYTYIPEENTSEPSCILLVQI